MYDLSLIFGHGKRRNFLVFHHSYYLIDLVLKQYLTTKRRRLIWPMGHIAHLRKYDQFNTKFQTGLAQGITFYTA